MPPWAWGQLSTNAAEGCPLPWWCRGAEAAIMLCGEPQPGLTLLSWGALAEGEVWLLGPGWSAASHACAWPWTPLICTWPLTHRLTSRLDLGPSSSLWTFLAITGLWLTLVAVTGPDPDLACC